MLRDDNFDVLVEHLSREGRMIVAGFTAKSLNGSENNDNVDNEEKDNSFVPTGINLLDFKSKDFESYR